MFTHIIASSSRAAFRPPLYLSRRLLGTSTILRFSQPFNRPGPPPLPPADQAEFEALVKAQSTIGGTPAATLPKAELEQLEQVEHRDLRRGPRAEFEGDTNPRTGEQGGPKIDPFKSGDNDWSYGGRVTVSSSQLDEVVS